MQDDIFISIDIECDGPCPGLHSMLSLGAAAFDNDGRLVSTFEANLKPIEGATQDPTTMKDFWEKNKTAWKYSTQNAMDAKIVMLRFDKWVNDLPGKEKRPVCTPAGFDFSFLYYYMHRFTGRSVLDFKCIDIRSYVSGMKGYAYQYSGKTSWPDRWRDRRFAHTHCALDDAIEQGVSFMRMRCENLKGKTAVYKMATNFEKSWKKYESTPSMRVDLVNVNDKKKK